MPEARKKILCIEDDRETAKLIANELSERGFYALVAYDARVGLQAIQKRIPDLVLCDVGLPHMTGFEILSAVNGSTLRSGHIPFIFLTGWTGREHELRGRSLGADDYVTKPIDFDVLEEIIRARLIRGVVRHEMQLRTAVSLGAKRPNRLRKSAQEPVMELTDAPTVNLQLHQAQPIATSNVSEDLAEAPNEQCLNKS